MRYRPSIWPAYKRLLERSSWPILVGPFRGEVGFEVLYWIPFLQTLRVDPSRIIPITRGGAAAWYSTPQGLELYAMRSPQDVRVENRRTFLRSQMMKQMAVSAFDRQVIRDAAETMKLRHYHVLHPSWMYQTLEPFWTAQRGLTWIQPRINVQTLGVPPLPTSITLPDRFIAAKFYTRPTFPQTQETLKVVARTLDQMSRHLPVVVLRSGHVDDHVDFPIKPRENVLLLTASLPEVNLAIQSAVVAKADAFVGTYGGFAQLALRLGKPSVSFYSDWKGTCLAHKHLADAVSLASGVPTQVLNVHELPFTTVCVPQMPVQVQKSQDVAPVSREPVVA